MAPVDLFPVQHAYVFTNNRLSLHLFILILQYVFMAYKRRVNRWFSFGLCTALRFAPLYSAGRLNKSQHQNQFTPTECRGVTGKNPLKMSVLPSERKRVDLSLCAMCAYGFFLYHLLHFHSLLLPPPPPIY